MQFSHVGGLQGVAATTLSLVLLAGCASPSPPKPDEAKVKRFAQEGYLTDNHYAFSTIDASWESPKSSFDVALMVPNGPGPFPLVIYLPALGETRSAGDAWRKAWAQGGYAVLSIQPLAGDADAWSSEEARAGNFSDLARERYSGKVMAARIQALRLALAELIRRHNQKEPPLDRINLSRSAVAGYDLGAYTAMVMAGESVDNTGTPAFPIPISAVIALSPYADFSGVALSERYRGIRGPVLSVTSDLDEDPLGLVTPPAMRKAPFKYMPAGDKYLLILLNVSHRTLAGGAINQDAFESRPPGETGRGRSHSFFGMGGGRHVESADTGGFSVRGPQPSMTTQAMGQTAIQNFTTAFLDVYLKNDPVAREWLTKNAPLWIKGHGEFQKK